MGGADLDAIAEKILASHGTSQTLVRSTEIHPEFGKDDGYRVAHLVHRLRVARGERQLGRKIGATNRAIYHLIGATGPAWGFMYDTTIGDLAGGNGSFAVGDFPLSRIEPEIAFRISRAPEPGMDEEEILACVDQVTHGFEFVYSPYGTWQVPPPDSIAAFGFHQAFIAGPWIDIGADRDAWQAMLKGFSIVMRNNLGVERHGGGVNVLGSPVLALKALVDDLGAHPEWLPLRAGEIVTTGTLTELMPAIAGESWTTTISGAPFAGLSVQLA